MFGDDDDEEPVVGSCVSVCSAFVIRASCCPSISGWAVRMLELVRIVVRICYVCVCLCVCVCVCANTKANEQDKEQQEKVQFALIALAPIYPLRHTVVLNFMSHRKR